MSRFVKKLLDKRNAPAAPRAGTVTFADLAGATRLVDANEVTDLPFGNMEAVAEFVIRLHSGLLVVGFREFRFNSDEQPSEPNHHQR